MEEPSSHPSRGPGLGASLLAVLSVVIVTLLVGFVWLPSGQHDFGPQGLWASICRAAGVPAGWGGSQGPFKVGLPTTAVVIEREMARPGDSASIGRGATLTLQCSICHGVKGLSGTNAPNLAGQYPEVVVKQLADYKRGDRISSIMQALSQSLTQADVHDVAAYYAYLPRAVNAPLSADHASPALVRVGDPMRNIAPCASCHGGIDHKLGAPWLEGMPAQYIEAQLKGFQSGQRRNDATSQMRNMARTLSSGEIVAIAAFYASRNDSR
jgi:cytochrome c553